MSSSDRSSGSSGKNINLPSHIGYIVDGNRRWAKANGLASLQGHKRGFEVLRDISIASIEAGVQYVSAFCFSTENWNRSKTEVSYLMKLIVKLLNENINDMADRNIRIVHVGARDGLPKSVLVAIDKAVAKTADCTKGTLALCINYGGQQEIVDATKKLLRQRPDPVRLTIDDFSKALYTPYIPDIDLVVRTSGEYRTSGFMLWRTAYAEYSFVDKCWPDFTKQDLKLVLLDYARRHRRFGK
ncbi:di-trans,poly-cis-decaprenylcistransferase [Candidatus Saccharibacteria bacterium]|nr:di-trans,poly-cis-decaprenylcistransferase [Candidatus Saccharibacteria bacterium]